MTRTGGTLFHLLCRGGPCARPQPEWPSATRMVVRNQYGSIYKFFAIRVADGHRGRTLQSNKKHVFCA